MMDKLQRNNLTKKFYIRRLKRHSHMLYSNKLKRKATWKEIYDNREDTILKTCSVFCSCYTCSGYYKYDRKKYKAETKRLLEEESQL